MSSGKRTVGNALFKAANGGVLAARAICLETGVQSYPMVLAIIGLSWDGCVPAFFLFLRTDNATRHHRQRVA